MKTESGRSMVEMLGVLAIMGLITTGAITLVYNGLKLYKRMTVNDEVLTIVTEVRNLFSEYNDYSSLEQNTVFKAIGISDINAYGGKYELRYNPFNTKQFIVTITGLTRTECSYFVTKAWYDSVDFKNSEGKKGGATGDCNKIDDKNFVNIIYGE